MVGLRLLEIVQVIRVVVLGIDQIKRWGDVTENRRRTRLADALKDFGKRVQLSVFECRLDEKQIASLRARLAKLIEPEKDSVRIYRLCGECSARLEILGVGPITEDPDVFVL